VHLLFLSSARPCFETGTAVNVVLAALLDAVVKLGHQVSWAIVKPDDAIDLSSERHLIDSGVNYVGDFSGDAIENRLRRPFRSLQTVRKAIWSHDTDDDPRFSDPSRTVSALKASGADAAVLFWDTWFEHLLPDLRAIPTVIYGARPRHAAAMTLQDHGAKAAGVIARLRHMLTRRMLRHQMGRHYRRVASVAQRANICALDAAIYRGEDLSCGYIPNTWPDSFGAKWRENRAAAQSGRNEIGILGNMSAVTNTGNLFGITYLGNEILPLLDEAMPNDGWCINITGRGKLPDAVARSLAHPRVSMTGFVPDLDLEMLSNQIFLILNNAGPYTGGYTRVVYAMASGTCLIAHKKLADSMPEVRHGVNALLGDTPSEIAALVAQACGDESLRERLGRAARQTYETQYHPSVVAGQILELAREARGE
jgi:hypothetical protein